MDVDIEPPVPLPSAPSRTLSSNLTLQPPLSRRGHGPGLLIICSDQLAIDEEVAKKSLDPQPRQKWAEEGYAVVRLSLPLPDDGNVKQQLVRGIEALKELEECDAKDKVGLIIYDSNILSTADVKSLDTIPEIVGIVSYGPAIQCNKPQIAHLPTNIDAPSTFETLTVHKYPDVKSANFVLPGHTDFKSGAAGLSHTRSLTFLKPKLGPHFDLEAIWDEHVYFEFEERSVAKTMGTMVQEPYVNHLPTITGGIGREKLTLFYRNHFIFQNPPDGSMEVISRTVGIDRIVDEFVFSFTHTEQIDWLAPGIPPTNKPVRLPAVSIVNVRGDRLYHEHIWWDQASLLRQLGLLPEYLAFPYPLADGRTPAEGKRFEYRVPTVGGDAARKLQDGQAVESNLLFDGKVREVDER